jgi:hypothetical protein
VQREGGAGKSERSTSKPVQEFCRGLEVGSTGRRARFGCGYDEAARLLVDLSEAYKVYAGPGRFQEELMKFMIKHARRKTLVQRLVKAGIWEDR